MESHDNAPRDWDLQSVVDDLTKLKLLLKERDEFFPRPSSEDKYFSLSVLRDRIKGKPHLGKSHGVVSYETETFEKAVSDGYLKRKQIIYITLHTPIGQISGTILRKQYKNIKKNNPMYKFDKHKVKFNDMKKDIITENWKMYQSNLYFLPRLPLWKFVPY